MIRKQQYVRKSISNMTEGYDYYDTEILLNGIPVGGLSQHGYLGTAGFGLRLKTVISTYRFRFS